MVQNEVTPEVCTGAGLSNRSRTVLRICRIGLLVFFLVLGIVSVRKGWYEPPEPGQSPDAARRRKHRGTDFTAYYSAGELARQGRDVYDWPSSSTPFRPYIYPPFFAILPMALLSLLPHNAALAVFYVLNVVLLLLSVWLLRKLLWPPGEGGPGIWRAPETAVLIGMFLCLRFLDSNLKLGNANIIILFLCVLGLYALRAQKGVWGGLAVAYATAVKATPGLFGLYFFWTRRGWAMLGGALGLVLFLLVIPSGVLGWSQNLAALDRFAAEAGLKFSTPEETGGEEGAEDPVGGEGDEGTRAIGVSLRGTFLKLFSPTVSMHHRAIDDTRSVNILNLPPQTTARIATALALVLLGLTVWLTAGRAAQADALTLALSWSLVTMTMLLISPLTRKAHCVVALLPVIVLMAALQQERLTGLARKAAWMALAGLPVATLLTAEGVIGERGSEYLHAIGVITWAMLLLYAAVALALRQIVSRTVAARAPSS